MANEAFALSPMSARAAEPNEQDYDAIREAFMETARGRWFLGEYAKRNRNADTRMVLDAVAKIEETLAAQRQPVVEDRLPEALVEIRRAIEEAETRAIAAFDPAAVEANLAPIPRGVRIIKEISWRWREIGADGRICDLIDSQLASIESACAQISAIDPRAELKAAFALLRDRTGQLGSGDTAPQPAAPRPAAAQDAPAAAAPTQPVVARDEPVVSTETTQHVATEPEAAIETASAAEAFAIAEPAMEVAIAPEIAAEPPPAEMTGEVSLDAAAQAEDDAVLDAIALEMAAPDPEFDDILEPVGMDASMPAPIAAQVASPAAAEPVAEPIAPEPVDDAPIAMESLVRLTDAIAEAAAEVMEPPAPVMTAAPNFGAMQSATLPMPSPLSAPPAEVSLGASIIASGMLEKPRAANDPLAPIRRMTQAEKIAFFS